MNEQPTEIVTPVRANDWQVPMEPVRPWSYVERPVVDDTAVRLRTANKLIQIVYFLFGVIEGLIAIRFLLRLLGANPANLFAQLVYGLTWPFVFAFADLVPTPTFGPVVVELYSLIAVVVYVLITYALVRLIEIALKP